MKKYLTVHKTCAFARVSRWTMYRWVTSCLVHAVRDGNDKNSPIRIDAASLLAFLAGKAEM